ncbi:MAG: hypothetical protein CSA52_01765 [Gammaproteobacteria bacterium]|nr:MAG: hypothetical protein CSB48_01470 [Pseudomonadota bacterium]PIE38588.1 MAG: hypothetical protein CSA52_01765 [Gammaproteobacteria bacterium]
MMGKQWIWATLFCSLILTGCATRYPQQQQHQQQHQEHQQHQQEYRQQQQEEVVSGHPQPEKSRQGEAQPDRDGKTIARPRQYEVPLSPAADSLLNQARRENRAGNGKSALIKAERAQRLSPKSPVVYQVLGEIWQSQKSWHKAEQFYRKAISLAGRNRGLVSELWKKVALVRQYAGKQ